MSPSRCRWRVASRSRRGDSGCCSTDQRRVTAEPNTHETRSFTITNTGSKKQHLVPSLEMLGAPIAGATLNVTLDPSTDPTFINVTGAPRAYVKHTFTVPAGAEHLDAAIAWHPSRSR